MASGMNIPLLTSCTGKVNAVQDQREFSVVYLQLICVFRMWWKTEYPAFETFIAASVREKTNHIHATMN